MKKIITLLLLCVFCIEPVCLAQEIIVGTDGQARYANQESAGIEQPKNLNSEIGSKEIKIDITPEAPRNIDEKTREAAQKAVSKYDKKNQKIIKTAKKSVIFKKNNIVSYEKNTNERLIKIKLQDGDYVLWKPIHNRKQIATEYHQDGSIMGFVEMHIGLSGKTQVYYEYRVTSSDNLKSILKHVMICKNKNVFIYTVDGTLRTALIDSVLYQCDGLNLPSLATDIQFMDTTAADNILDFFMGNDGIDGHSESMSIAIMSAYTGVGFFVVAPIMFALTILSPFVGLVALPFSGTSDYDRFVINSINNGEQK